MSGVADDQGGLAIREITRGKWRVNHVNLVSLRESRGNLRVLLGIIGNTSSVA